VPLLVGMPRPHQRSCCDPGRGNQPARRASLPPGPQRRIGIPTAAGDL